MTCRNMDRGELSLSPCEKDHARAEMEQVQSKRGERQLNVEE